MVWFRTLDIKLLVGLH